MDRLTNYEKDVIIAIKKARLKRGIKTTLKEAIEIFEHAKKTMESYALIAWKKQQIKDANTIIVYNFK